MKVTVYSNGFVVGDGPFRPSDGSEENEAFLRDVGRGIVPRELEDRAGAGAVNLGTRRQARRELRGAGLHRLLRRRPDAYNRQTRRVSFLKLHVTNQLLMMKNRKRRYK